jgi:D-alanyl-D-alanine dipeptidase
MIIIHIVVFINMGYKSQGKYNSLEAVLYYRNRMLFEITEDNYPITLDIQYATSRNFTGKPVYTTPKCYLRDEVKPLFEKAIFLAAQQNMTFKIFDAFRPQKAQEALWNFCPDPMYIANPASGSHHTRGVAIDLTLVNKDGIELDMGTPFDDFELTSHHGSLMSPEVQHNRFLLLGIMMTAGFDFYTSEWWHYQVFNPRQFDLINDDMGMM